MGKNAHFLQSRLRLIHEVGSVHRLTGHQPLSERPNAQNGGFGGVPEPGEYRRRFGRL